jgi:universal stress protein E
LIAAMREYLQPFAERIAAENLAVSIEATCDTPLYQCIVHKVVGSNPDLVMKAAAGEVSDGHANLSLNDWHLVRASPVPLLLSRARTWPAQPHFAAVVDVTEEETPGLAATILRAADSLRAAGGGGELDVLFAEILDADEQGRKVHAATLAKLAKEAHIDVPQIRLLAGDPSTTLSASAVGQQYDVLVLGALTHREHLTPLVGTLTRKLMETLDCDFVLMKGATP